MTYIVLIVDAKPAQSQPFAHSLQTRLGYKTILVSSGSEALSRFETMPSFSADLILFDCPSEGLGPDRAALKALAQRAPLIALVKYGDYDIATAALNDGAQDFLVKPVAIERMSTTFRNILQLREARREVEHSLAQPPAPRAQLSFPLIGEDGHIRPMEEIESEVIRFALHHYHGRMTEVARRLRIGRSTLYRKLNGFSLRQKEAA